MGFGTISGWQGGGVAGLLAGQALSVATLVATTSTNAGALTATTGAFTGTVRPSADNTYNLGAAGACWSDVYINALKDTDNDARLTCANNAATVINGNVTSGIAVKIADTNTLNTVGDRICNFYAGTIATTIRAGVTIDGCYNPNFTDDSANPGSRTLNVPAGISAFAGGAGTFTITNSCVLASSVVLVSLQTVDGTLTSIKTVVPSAGSFVVTGNANATGTTKVGWVVFNGA